MTEALVVALYLEPMVHGTTARSKAETDSSSLHVEATGSSRLWRFFGALPFIACHLILILAFFTPIPPIAWVVCVVLFVVRMWGVTAGYHRYFSHRAFRTSRVFQFFLAFLAQSSAQKGVLWWASNHRHHHKYSDQEEDLHSPVQDGFWYSHIGWLFEPKNQATDEARIGDFLQFRELRVLNRFHLIPPIILGVACSLSMGFGGLLIGFFLSTVLLWHATFFINSLAHVFGSRRYDTTDDSRNSLFLAVLTLGEGWHNNHHRYQASARNGFFKGEIDPTYWMLRLLARFGIVWDLRPVPNKVLEEGRRADAARFEAERHATNEKNGTNLPPKKPAFTSP